MPQKLNMIIPVTSNNIHVYYQIAILNSFADENSLKLVIQIPITSNEEILNFIHYNHYLYLSAS